MIINLGDPDMRVPVVTRHVCEHHKRDPWDVNYAGCTCSTAFSSRTATPEERVENKRRREEFEARRAKHIADYDAGRNRECI